MDFVSPFDSSPLQNSGKYPFLGHNTFSHALINLTVVMTLLSNLGHFQHHISYPETAAHRQSGKVKSLYHQIFSKSAEVHFCSSCLKILNFLYREHAHLTMPRASVSISQNPPLWGQFCFYYFRFCSSSLFTDTDCSDISHFYPPIFHISRCSVICSVCAKQCLWGFFSTALLSSSLISSRFPALTASFREKFSS